MHAFELFGPLFAAWLREQNAARPVRFEKVERGHEQILPPHEQRELHALQSGLDRIEDA